MSVAVLEPIHARLPAMDPRVARGRNRVLAALSGLRVDDPAGLLTVSAEIGQAETGPALVFSVPPAWVAITPVILENRPAELLELSGDLAGSLAALGRLEPLLAALERSCGSALDPREVGWPDAAAAVALRLTLSDESGAPVHAADLLVGLPLAERWPAPGGLLSGLGAAAQAGVPCRLWIEGPTIEAARLQSLAVGDLVLLSRSALGWTVRLAPSGSAADLLGRLELPSARLLVRSIQEIAMLDAAPDARPLAEAASDDRDRGLDLAALPVPLTVELERLTLTVGELAMLRPGSTLTLPDLGDSPRALLRAEGRVVAEGRLTALGEAYGLLIERLTA